MANTLARAVHRSLKLLFINQYYWPDSAATAQMLSDLCEHLAQLGHEVHVLCSRGKYDDTSQGSGTTPRYELRRGVHVHRITATGFAKRSEAGRVIDYASFHLLIGLRTLLTGWRYDAIVTLTTPPLVGLYATPIKLLSRTRHFCWVMDLHPDCEVELGVFDPRKIGPRILEYLNALHLRKADRCVVLGDRMARRLTDKRVDERRITAIPVWGHEIDTGENAGGGSSLRQELGLGGRFVVMYSGNAGLIHTFDEVCDAMHRLRDDGRFAFLFVGGGRRMKQVQQFAAEHKLPNVQFRGYFPRERLGESLALGDVHLITLRPSMAGVAVPSKLYGIMAAGRPAVFVGPADCESAQAIREHGCGVALPTGDADALVRALEQLAADADLRRRMGDAARRAYETTYNATACCERWREVIERHA